MQIVTPSVLPDDYRVIDYRHVDCSDRPIAAHEAVAQLPARLDTSSVSYSWGADSSLVRPDDFDATSLASYIDDDGRPPLLLYVTTFHDATVVSLLWSHVLFDGAGLAAFLRAWSLVVNGKGGEVPSILADPMPRIMEEANKEDEDGGERPTFPAYKFVLIVLWIVWRTWTKPRNESRFVVLTKEAVGRLRRGAAADGGASDISDGALITAWLAKLLAASDRDYRTANIVGTLNVRRSLPELQTHAAGGEYVQNLVASFFITLPSETVRAPTAQLAAHIRDQTRQRTAAASVRRYFRDRHDASLTSRRSGIYDPRSGGAARAVVLPVFVNNMASLRLAEVLDFTSAVVAQGGAADGSRANPVGTPLYLRNSNAAWTSRRMNIPAFAVQGRSAEGSYYVDACLPPRTFVLMEESLRASEAS